MSQVPEAVDDAEVIAGGVLSAAELAAWDHGLKAAANTLPMLTDTLGRLVTLNTAFIGGGLVVAKAEVLPFPAAVAVLGLQFASLVFAGWGLWPRAAELVTDDLDALVEFRRRAVGRRSVSLVWSARLFVLSLLVALAGVVWKGT